MNDCIMEAYENLSDENVIVNLNCCKILGPDCAIMLCDIFQKAYKINSTIIQYSVDYVTKTFGWKWDKQNQLLKKLESLKLITTMKKGIPPIRYVKLNKHNTKQLIEDMNGYKELHIQERQKNYKKAIYLLKSGDYYKIGIASDVERRVKELNCRPYPIQVVKHSEYVKGATKIEAALHKKYSQKRINGEWFNLDEDDVKFICEYFDVVN